MTFVTSFLNYITFYNKEHEPSIPVFDIKVNDVTRNPSHPKTNNNAGAGL